MTKYAYFDHLAPDPKPVLGWYDTTLNDYPTMPAAEDLLEVTDPEWDGRMLNPSGWAISAGALIAFTLPPDLRTLSDAELKSRIGNGITITSIGNPGLNATYGLDSLTMSEIGAVARDFASGLGLPGNSSVFTYPDITGLPPGHTFTGDQLVNMYKAMRNLMLALGQQASIMRMGGTPSWPEQSAEIP